MFIDFIDGALVFCRRLAGSRSGVSLCKAGITSSDFGLWLDDGFQISKWGGRSDLENLAVIGVNIKKGEHHILRYPKFHQHPQYPSQP